MKPPEPAAPLIIDLPADNPPARLCPQPFVLLFVKVLMPLPTLFPKNPIPLPNPNPAAASGAAKAAPERPLTAPHAFCANPPTPAISPSLPLIPPLF